jgi:hypothetical protein
MPRDRKEDPPCSQELAHMVGPTFPLWIELLQYSPLWNCLDLKPTIYTPHPPLVILRRGGIEIENTIN